MRDADVLVISLLCIRYLFNQILFSFFCCSFLCGYYSRVAFISFERPADTNDGRIKYVRVIQWRLLDAVSSMHSLTVLLSAMEKSHTTQTALVLDHILLFACVCAAYASRSYYSKVVLISFRASDCVATIRGWWLFESGDYSRVVTIRGWHLFKGCIKYGNCWNFAWNYIKETYSIDMFS